MNNCERYIEGKEPIAEKMNEIFDKTTERIAQLKKLHAQLKHLDRAYKRMDLKFDLMMSMLLIVNILLFIWTKGFFQMFNIGFISGMWLANILYRGIRRI